MKLKYLGTAAAEGLPGIYCECDNCKKSRKLGGKNIRSRSQALIHPMMAEDETPCDSGVAFSIRAAALSAATAHSERSADFFMRQDYHIWRRTATPPATFPIPSGFGILPPCER